MPFDIATLSRSENSGYWRCHWEKVSWLMPPNAAANLKGKPSATWGYPARIAPATLEDDRRFNETTIFHLGGGQWLAAVRWNGLDLFRSDDDAKTWKHRQRLSEANQHPGHLTRLKDGPVLLSFGNRVTPKGVDVRFSDDQGQTWGAPFRVVDFEDDGGYPSSVQLPDGRVLTAYYARRIAGHDRYHMGVVVWDPTSTRRR